MIDSSNDSHLKAARKAQRHPLSPFHCHSSFPLFPLLPPTIPPPLLPPTIPSSPLPPTIPLPFLLPPLLTPHQLRTQRRPQKRRLTARINRNRRQHIRTGRIGENLQHASIGHGLLARGHEAGFGLLEGYALVVGGEFEVLDVGFGGAGGGGVGVELDVVFCGGVGEGGGEG